ncbi:hypothetical protein DRH14_05585, partial [Candidatus Shapirobacteria bacterium]
WILAEQGFTVYAAFTFSLDKTSKEGLFKFDKEARGWRETDETLKISQKRVFIEEKRQDEESLQKTGIFRVHPIRGPDDKDKSKSPSINSFLNFSLILLPVLSFIPKSSKKDSASSVSVIRKIIGGLLGWYTYYLLPRNIREKIGDCKYKIGGQIKDVRTFRKAPDALKIRDLIKQGKLLRAYELFWSEWNPNISEDTTRVVYKELRKRNIKAPLAIIVTFVSSGLFLHAFCPLVLILELIAGLSIVEWSIVTASTTGTFFLFSLPVAIAKAKKVANTSSISNVFSPQPTIFLLDSGVNKEYVERNPDIRAVVSINKMLADNDPGIHKIIKHLYDENILIIASAGNRNTTSAPYPAAYNEVMAVAATDKSGKKAGYSNYGSWVDAVALGHYDENHQGTSFAVPRVAALASNIFLRNPNLLNEEVIQIIKNTAGNINDWYYHKGLLGSEVVNPKKALAKVTSSQKGFSRFRAILKFFLKKSIFAVGLPTLLIPIFFIGIVSGSPAVNSIISAKGISNDLSDEEMETLLKIRNFEATNHPRTLAKMKLSGFIDISDCSVREEVFRRFPKLKQFIISGSSAPLCPYNRHGWQVIRKFAENEFAEIKEIKWLSENNLKEHCKKHYREIFSRDNKNYEGDIRNSKEYEDASKQIIESKKTEIFFTARENIFVFYNRKKNIQAVINREGKIITFFKPEVREIRNYWTPLNIPDKSRPKFYSLFSSLAEIKEKIERDIPEFLRNLTRRKIKNSLKVKQIFEDINQFCQFASKEEIKKLKEFVKGIRFKDNKLRKQIIAAIKPPSLTEPKITKRGELLSALLLLTVLPGKFCSGQKGHSRLLTKKFWLGLNKSISRYPVPLKLEDVVKFT